MYAIAVLHMGCYAPGLVSLSSVWIIRTLDNSLISPVIKRLTDPGNSGKRPCKVIIVWFPPPPLRFHVVENIVAGAGTRLLVDHANMSQLFNVN